MGGRGRTRPSAERARRGAPRKPKLNDDGYIAALEALRFALRFVLRLPFRFAALRLVFRFAVLRLPFRFAVLRFAFLAITKCSPICLSI